MHDFLNVVSSFFHEQKIVYCVLYIYVQPLTQCFVEPPFDGIIRTCRSFLVFFVTKKYIKYLDFFCFIKWLKLN